MATEVSPALRPRVQVAQAVLIGFVVLGLGMLVYLWGLGNPIGGLTFALVTPVSVICYVALRRDPSTLVISTHLVSFVLLLMGCFLAWNNTGGLGAPALFVLPVIPLLVAFLLGPKHAVFWGAVCALTPVGFLAVQSHAPPVALTPQALLAAQVVSPFLSVLTVLGLALSYERNMSLQREALKRATEQALEASRAKSAFLASMSHEIRTPLGGILGLAELLSATQLSKEQAGMVELLEGSGSSLLTLLNDVLDFSRVEAGALELERRPVDLQQLAAEVTGLLENHALDKGIALTAHQRGPAWVLGDPLRLRQILINLVSNALKFTAEGQVEVEISTEAGPANTLQVELQVRDSGPGIAPEVQERLFQPFTQADEGIARQHGGSGLGLAIVARLTQLMHGQVRVESVLGEGALFVVSLELPACQPIAQKAEKTPTVTPGLRVLLAEDNLVNQRVFLAMLHKLGCETQLAPDGRLALAAVAESAEGFDLILMDCQMPNMNGLQAAQRLRAQGYAGPIVALTANVTPQDRLACQEAGMDGFLPKPLPLNLLAVELSKL